MINSASKCLKTTLKDFSKPEKKIPKKLKFRGDIPALNHLRATYPPSPSGQNPVSASI
jgi:hypothetical protein